MLVIEFGTSGASDMKEFLYYIFVLCCFNKEAERVKEHSMKASFNEVGTTLEPDHTHGKAA